MLGSVSELLRERGATSWAAAVSHPMVAEIGAGSLPHETFRYYFEQNVPVPGGLRPGHRPDHRTGAGPGRPSRC